MYASPTSVSLTNIAGRTIEVQLLKATGTEVEFRISGGRKKHTLKLSDLDQASRTKIQKWQSDGGGSSTDLDITFTSGKSSRVSKREQYDDKTLRLRPTVTIKNSDNLASTRKLSMTLLLLGRPVLDSSLYYVFSKDVKTTDKIAPGDSFFTECSDVKVEYDNKGSAQFGAKYYGYVIMVQDPDGVIVASKSIPSSLFTKHGKKLLELQPKQCYTRDLKKDGFYVKTY